MKSFFAPNISRKGRILRGCVALVFVGAGVLGFKISPWLAAMLLIIGLFVAVESVRGWCLLRACGIKTRW